MHIPTNAMLRRIASVAITFVIAAVADAQSVRGRVVELPGNKPLADAQVVLWSDSTTVVATTRTDSVGIFLVHAPKPGLYFINVRKLGYQGGATGELSLTEPQEYEIVIKTPKIAPVLSGVNITAKGRAGDFMMQGFEQPPCQGRRRCFFSRTARGIGA